MESLSERREASLVRSRAGFTLVEIMVALAVTALVALVALPWFTGMNRANRLASTTRQLVGQLNGARLYAGTGRQLPGGSCGSTERARGAGIRFLSETHYEVVLWDGDSTRCAIEDVDLEVLFPDQPVRITYPPANSVITFRNDGSAEFSGFTDGQKIIVRDADFQRQRTIQVSSVGILRVD